MNCNTLPGSSLKNSTTLSIRFLTVIFTFNANSKNFNKANITKSPIHFKTIDKPSENTVDKKPKEVPAMPIIKPKAPSSIFSMLCHTPPHSSPNLLIKPWKALNTKPKSPVNIP